MFDERLWKDANGNAMPRRSPIPTSGGAALDLSATDADFTSNPLRAVWIGNTAGNLVVRFVEDQVDSTLPVAANTRFDGVIAIVRKTSTCGTISPLR
jgi:hypothetical protein